MQNIIGLQYSNSQFDNYIDGTLSETVHCFLVLLKGENPNLLYAWFLWVEEWPGLHMLGNQFTAHLGDFLPLPQNRQGQLLFMVFTTFYELKKGSFKFYRFQMTSLTCYMTIKLKFQYRVYMVLIHYYSE